MERGECSCFARLVFSCSNSRPRNRYAQLSLRVYARSLQRSEMEGQGRGRDGIAIEKATWKRKMVREKSIKRASNLSRSRNEAFSIRPFANFLYVPTVFIVSLFLANVIRTADKTPSVTIITSYVSIEFLEILFDLSKEQIFIGNPCDATTSRCCAYFDSFAFRWSLLFLLCVFPSLPSYSSSSSFLFFFYRKKIIPSLTCPTNYLLVVPRLIAVLEVSWLPACQSFNFRRLSLARSYSKVSLRVTFNRCPQSFQKTSSIFFFFAPNSDPPYLCLTFKVN